MLNALIYFSIIIFLTIAQALIKAKNNRIVHIQKDQESKDTTMSPIHLPQKPHQKLLDSSWVSSECCGSYNNNFIQ